MKLKSTCLIFTACIFTLYFTSCKKEGFKTATATTVNVDDANKASAIRFAVNFYKSAVGIYGGAELKNGLTISSVNPAARNGKVLQSINPLCGMVIDTTADNIIKNDTTRYHYGGSYSFTYTCGTNAPNGYLNNNSFFTATQTTNTYDTLHIVQNYNVKALDNTYKLVSLDGNMIIYEHKLALNAPYYMVGTYRVNFDYHNDYTTYALNGIKVDLSSGTPDMTSGTAKLTDTQSILNQNNLNIDALTNISSTITFLGNHLARVEGTIASAYGPQPTTPMYVYTVNVLTGQIVN